MNNKKIFNKKIVAFVISVFIFTVLAVPAITAAQSGPIDPISGFGLNYTDEIGLSTTDVRTTIVRVIRAILGFLGIAALIIILIGGVKWMTAGGSDDKVGEAQKYIGYGVIGITVIFVAYALTIFVFNVIFRATIQ